MAKILLVDDNVGLLNMQSAFLRRSGHEVTTALNGDEGIRLAEREAFDLVVTDLVMPEKEGIEMIIELRRKIPQLKIIAMSGGGRSNANDYLSMARKLGALRTLAKPFSGQELIDAVTGVLNGTSETPSDQI